MATIIIDGGGDPLTAGAPDDTGFVEKYLAEQLIRGRGWRIATYGYDRAGNREIGYTDNAGKLHTVLVCAG